MIHIENMQQPGLCENLYTSHQLTPLLQYPRIKQKEMIILFFPYYLLHQSQNKYYNFAITNYCTQIQSADQKPGLLFLNSGLSSH